MRKRVFVTEFSSWGVFFFFWSYSFFFFFSFVHLLMRSVIGYPYMSFEVMGRRGTTVPESELVSEASYAMWCVLCRREGPIGLAECVADREAF